MTEKLSWFRYVRFDEVDVYEKQGWRVVSDLGPTHGQWALLMQWGGNDEPPSSNAPLSPGRAGVKPDLKSG